MFISWEDVYQACMVLLDVKRCKLPLPLEQLLPLLACFLAGKTLILIDFLAASQNYKAANWSSKFWAASAVPQIPVKYLIRSTLLEDTLSIVPSSSTAVSCCQEGLEKGTPQIFVKMMWLYIRCICIGWLRSLWTESLVCRNLWEMVQALMENTEQSEKCLDSLSQHLLSPRLEARESCQPCVISLFRSSKALAKHLLQRGGKWGADVSNIK